MAILISHKIGCYYTLLVAQREEHSASCSAINFDDNSSLSFSFKEHESLSGVVEGTSLYTNWYGAQRQAQKAFQNARRSRPHHKHDVWISFTNNGISYAMTMMGKSATAKIAPQAVCNSCHFYLPLLLLNGTDGRSHPSTVLGFADGDGPL